MSRVGVLASALTVALLALAVVPSRAWAVPEITGPVTDTIGLISPESTQELSQRLRAVHDAGGAQIAVLFVRSTDGVPIEDFSIQTAQQWRGGAQGRDNGVLITFAIREHRSRIEVGYGLESELTDSRSRQILDGLRPRLRAGDFAGASWDAADGVITALGGASVPAPAFVVPAGVASRPRDPQTIAWMVFAGAVLAAIALAALLRQITARRIRMAIYDSDATRYWDGAQWVVIQPGTLPPVGAILGNENSPPVRPRRYESTWSSSAWSSSDSGSSGGSDYDGGGGSFGGGGASSDW